MKNPLISDLYHHPRAYYLYMFCQIFVYQIPYNAVVFGINSYLRTHIFSQFTQHNDLCFLLKDVYLSKIKCPYSLIFNLYFQQNDNLIFMNGQLIENYLMCMIEWCTIENTKIEWRKQYIKS